MSFNNAKEKKIYACKWLNFENQPIDDKESQYFVSDEKLHNLNKVALKKTLMKMKQYTELKNKFDHNSRATDLHLIYQMNYYGNIYKETALWLYKAKG